MNLAVNESIAATTTHLGFVSRTWLSFSVVQMPIITPIV